MPDQISDSAREAYDTLAPAYDEFNIEGAYEHWLGDVLVPELAKHGLKVGRVLDVGCGTGHAFDPLLSRGWEVFGVDGSAAMLREAAKNRAASLVDGPVPLAQFDARELPKYREPFDLVILLNDVVNCLTEDGDLERCFDGVARNLSPTGLVCFDANNLSLYESEWLAGSAGAMTQSRGWNWTALTREAVPGGIFEVELGAEGVDVSLHRQRHWPRPAIEAALTTAGLRVCAVLGQRENDGRVLLGSRPDEVRHHKMVFVAGSAQEVRNLS
jgi:SAM-dependent methyltransferase